MNATDMTEVSSPPVELRLWPGPAPFSVANSAPERFDAVPDQPGNHHVSNVSVPTLTVFSPARERNSGIAVVICPGGSYAFLSWEKEGIHVARWLQERGVTGAVLKYRLPIPDRVASGHLRPLLDAQQAIRVLRQRAGEFGIKTNRVGILGFSAGGNLAACAATKFAQPVSDAAVDMRVSCRPDFCALLYPVISMLENTHSQTRDNLLGANSTAQLWAEFSCEKNVIAETPPIFLVHARDDATVPVANALMFAQACQNAGIPVEIHFYDEGGHGFGLGVNGGEVTNWPVQFTAFLDRFR